MTFLDLLTAARVESAKACKDLRWCSDDSACGSGSGGRVLDDDCESARELLEYLEHLDSEGWAALDRIEDRAMDVFQGLARDPTEHSHTMHELHRDYVDSLEATVESFARRQGRSFDEIMESVRKGMLRGDRHASAVIRAVEEATDFVSWAREMRRSAALKAYALPDSDYPERGYANLRRRHSSSSSNDDQSIARSRHSWTSQEDDSGSEDEADAGLEKALRLRGTIAPP